MTVSSEINSIPYAGNGVTVAFAFPYLFYNDADLLVLSVAADGTVTTLVLNVGYTVDGAGVSIGGTVTTTVAPASGTTLTITRSPAAVQESHYVSTQPFPSATVERGYDYLTMLCQRLLQRVKAAIHYPDGESNTDATLAPVSTRKGTYLFFDAVTGAISYAVNLAVQTLTQAVFNAFYILTDDHKRTASEIAAGIVPTNYVYEPGDIRRYGAIGDGVLGGGGTDNTTAIQAAFNVARYSCVVKIRSAHGNGGKTIYNCGFITAIYENTHVTADHGAWLQLNVSSPLFSCLLQAVGTYGSAINLSADATQAALTVTVASTAGLAVGQVVRIADSTYKVTSPSNGGQNAELNQIASITGAGPFTITLQNELIGVSGTAPFAYATARTAFIQPQTLPARHIRFEDVTINVPSTADGGGILIQEGYECDVLNCRVVGPKSQAGLQLWRSAYCHAIGLTVEDGQSPATPGYGYGVAMGASSHDCVVYDSTFRNVRENSMADNVRFSGFINCDAARAVDNAFSTHYLGSSDCFFVNCRAIYSQSKGFVAGATGAVNVNSPDNRIRFVNCKSYFSNYIGFWNIASAGLEQSDNVFIDCEAWSPGVTAATSYGFYASRATRPKFVNCTVDGGQQANMRAGALIEICTDASWKGGEVRNTSNWGIIHENCTKVEISGVRFEIGGGTQQIHSTGTPSTGAWIHDNQGTSAVYTRNSGDRWENNNWNSNPDTATLAITYSASMTPDFSLCARQTITATNGTAFTINAPTNPTINQANRLTIVIRNTSGGALGVATWNAAYKMSAWTQPANTFNRSIDFDYDGTNWIQVSQTGVDVPN